MATIAELLGAALPEDAGEDSVSLLPLLRRLDKPVREYAISHSSRGLPCLRKGSWKIIFGSGGDGNEPRTASIPSGQLYDLATDLGERRNL